MYKIYISTEYRFIRRMNFSDSTHVPYTPASSIMRFIFMRNDLQGQYERSVILVKIEFREYLYVLYIVHVVHVCYVHTYK